LPSPRLRRRRIRGQPDFVRPSLTNSKRESRRVELATFGESKSSDADPQGCQAGTEPDGGDLDLHFVHPLAQSSGDGFFDLPFDVFWANQTPNWGSIDSTVDDDCALTPDDGNRSEQVDCPVLEHGCYKVGVNAWNDRGVGAADATVKVFVRDVLAYEVVAVRLDEYDMWTVAEICMPEVVGSDPTVAPRCAANEGDSACDDCGPGACSPVIQADYHHPYFAQP